MLASIAASLYRYSIGGQPQLVDLPDLIFGFHEWAPPAGAMVIATVFGVLAIGSGVVLIYSTDRRGAWRPAEEDVEQGEHRSLVG